MEFRRGICSDLIKTLICFILCLFIGCSWCSPSNDDALQPEDVSSNEVVETTKNPKLLVFMIDGFRWDYYEKHKDNMDGFEQFLAEGVQAEYVEPVFPSLSYPAWTTISTGVYPETHGIIGNYMYNKKTEEIFDLDNSTSTGNPNWWQTSEPIWTLGIKEGLKVFLRLWSRCDIPFDELKPNGCTPYRVVKGIEAIEETLRIAADELLENDLVMVYGEHIDNVGHEFGPDSPEMAIALKELNRAFKILWDALLDTSIEDKVNIVIIGDHGMTSARNFTYLWLGDYLDPKDVEFACGRGALVTIEPYAAKVDQVYNKLKSDMIGVDVYKRDEIPKKFHYKKNKMVHEIIVVAKSGYYIRGLRPNPNRSQPSFPSSFYSRQIPRESYDTRPVAGDHGYADTEDMRTIFFAKGPAFKKGIVHPPIHMADIYQILAKTLNIPPKPHNGTWSKVVGMFINKGSTTPTPIILLVVTFMMGALITNI